MAIAIVNNVQGEVFAINEQGVRRRLQNGDQLQEGEVLVTAPDSSADLDMGGGNLVNVPEQQTFMPDGSVGGPEQPDTASSALESAAAAQRVIQALASGDVNALLEAEAAAGLAGGGAADGGSSFVQLLRISEGGTPVSYEDKLDLRDLLQGESHVGFDPGNLASYLHFSFDGGKTVLEVKTTGGFSLSAATTPGPIGGGDQSIEFNGVDLVGTNASDQNAIIQSLLTANKLIAD